MAMPSRCITTGEKKKEKVERMEKEPWTVLAGGSRQEQSPWGLPSRATSACDWL